MPGADANENDELGLSGGRSSSFDLFRAVAEDAKDGIDLPNTDDPAFGVDGYSRAEVWTDVLPHDIAIHGHFEEPSEPSLVDQGVSIRKALGVGDPWREEIAHPGRRVAPHDLLARHVELDDPGVGKAVVEPVRPVVEDQQVAVGQRCGDAAR